MKLTSVKLPTLARLAELFNDVRVINAGNGAHVNFGNDSDIDLKDMGKTVSLEFSLEDNWTWCIGVSSYTSVATDDLRILFPKRKFKAPRRFVRVGCVDVRLNDTLDLIAGSHTCTENEIAEMEELLAVRREMKKKT